MKSDKNRLSNLPGEIIDNILLRLPLEEVINTSLLSKTWRYQWRSMSEINIDYRSFRSTEEFVNKVIRFMLLQRGNILRFALKDLDGLSFSDLNFSDLNILLDHLDGHRVQQLTLDFTHFYDNCDDYLIPSLVYSFDKLTTLYIKFCGMIKLPSSFDGFKYLTSIVLHCITFASATIFQRLIDLSPLLKHLDLRVYDPFVLNLNAPNLRVLIYDAPFSRLSFMHTPLIEKISLTRTDVRCYDLSNLLGIFSKVSNLELSAINFCQVESALQEIKFNNLKILNLIVDPNCPQENAVVDCILENSPALVHLQITLALYINSFKSSSFRLKKHIKILDIIIYSGLTSEMKFIKYVLRNSSLLKVVNVKWRNNWVKLSIKKKDDILKELLSFERASSVKVYFFGPGEC